MAIYTDETVCSLCGRALDRPFMGLSWFRGNLPQEILVYGDSIMHVDCFDDWEHRLQFSEGAFTHKLELWHKSGSSRGYVLLQFENTALICGPIGSHTVGATPLVAEIMRQMSGWRADASAPLFTEVILRDWDLELRSNWYDWDEFINGGYKRQLEGLSLKSKAQIDSIIDDIRKDIPNLESLWKKLNEQIAKSDST